MSRRGGRTRRYTKTADSAEEAETETTSRPGTYGARRRSLLPGGKGTPGLLAACAFALPVLGHLGTGWRQRSIKQRHGFYFRRSLEGEVVSLDEIPEYRGETLCGDKRESAGFFPRG